MANQSFLKGKRTFITLGLMAVVSLTNFLAGHTVFTPEVQGAVQTILAAVAAYFRSQA